MRDSSHNTYEQALDVLRIVNTATINGVSITSTSKWGGISWWGAVQTHLYADIISLLHVARPVPVPLQIRKTSRWVRGRDGIIAYACSLFVLARGIFYRPAVLLFGPDVIDPKIQVDPRIGRVPLWLRSSGVRYVDFVHTRLGATTLRSLKGRRRAALYFDVARSFGKLLQRFGILPKPFEDCETPQLHNVAEELHDPLQRLIRAHWTTLNDKVATALVLRFIFRLIQPKRIWLFDDPRYWHEVLVAARDCAIPTCAFQHGRFNRYLVGFNYVGIEPECCIVPDRFVLWSQYWLDTLVQLSLLYRIHEKQLVVGGSASTKPNIGELAHALEDGIITVLLPFEALANDDEMRQFMQATLSCAGTRIIVKLRPDLPIDQQKIRFSITDERVAYTTEVTSTDFARIDVVAATYSTYLYEMIEAGRAVGVIVSSTTQAVDLIAAGLAQRLEVDDPRFCRAIHQLGTMDAMELQRRQEKIANPNKSMIENYLRTEISSGT